MSDEDRKKSKLRELYAYKAKLIEKREELLKRKVDMDADLEEVNGKLAGVQNGIDHIENRRLLITTHAIERYHQRINPDATEDLIRAHLITPQLLSMVSVLGNGQYPIEDFQVVVEDNKIITIITNVIKYPVRKHLVKESHKKARKYRN